MFKYAIKIKSIHIPIVYLAVIIVQLIICVGNFNTIFVDNLSVLLLGLILFYIFKQQPEMFTKYLYFFFAMIWAVVAVYMMENGTVDLRGRHSEHFGSLPLYVLSWMFFVCTVSASELKVQKRMVLRNEVGSHALSKARYTQIRIICIAQIILALFCFSLVAKNPYYLLAVDRFGYQQLYLSSTVNLLLPLLFSLIPIPLIIVKKNKIYTILYILLLVLIELFIGEKFSGLLLITYFFIISSSPEYITTYIRKNLRKIAVIAFTFILLLLISVYVQQVLLYSYSLEDFIKYLQDRVAAQGELWWLAYQQNCGFPSRITEIFDEVRIWIFQPTGKMIDYDFGIYKMMKIYMNSSWVNYALGTVGARAAESTRVTFLYYGGVLGLLAGQVFLGFITSKVVNGIIKYKERGNWIVTISYMYILKNLITAFSMSDFQLLTTKKAILAYMLIIIFSRRVKLVK